MGKITWQKRIRHFDRPVGGVRARRMGLTSRLLKDEVRRRLGRPSRSVSSELMRMKFDLMLAEFSEKRGRQVEMDVAALKKKIAWEELRSRLLERPRAIRAKAKARKIRAHQTNIFLWKRKQDWLREVEASRAACSEAVDDSD